MKISDLVARLREIACEHGDVEVKVAVGDAQSPFVADVTVELTEAQDLADASTIGFSTPVRQVVLIEATSYELPPGGTYDQHPVLF